MKRAFSPIVLIFFMASATAFGQSAPEHSLFWKGDWYKIAIKDGGIYKITPQQVPAIEGAATGSVKVYGHSGAMLPEVNANGLSHKLIETPIEIHDNNQNGVIDRDDYVMFYGDGAARWEYIAASKRYKHRRHAYSDFNYYFLTIDETTPSKRVTMAEMADPSQVINKNISVAVVDNDLLNLMGTGRIWIGEKFTSSLNTRTFPFQLDGNPTDLINVELTFVNDGTSDATFKATVEDETHYYTVSSGTSYRTFEGTFNQVRNKNFSMDVTYVPRSNMSNGYLDYIEINANVSNSYTGSQNTLRFADNGGSGNAKYPIGSEATSSQPRVWDITDLDDIREYPVKQSDGYRYFVAPCEGPRQIVLFANSAALAPSSIQKIENQDLHGADSPDMIIVCNKQFVSQSEQLGNLHRIIDGMDVSVMTDEQVYNEFSSGKQDPLAIREMLRMFRQRDPEQSPQYLLIFGKGSYDNRNILGMNSNTVATYESESSFDDNGSSYCSDIILGFLDNGESGKGGDNIDISIGRLPAQNATEANFLVQKIEQYMMKQDLADGNSNGEWRNTVALLADDADPSSASDTIFTYSAEALATKIKTRYPVYNLDRIYADAFQQQTGAIGSFYPDVNNALKQRIDNGCLMLNYIGHGSTQYIGTERYMETDDITSYTNRDKLAFFITSTCSFGKYDIPNERCGAESFILAPGAGIAVISAARPIIHVEIFNTALCMNALNKSNRIGDALRIAKNQYSASHCIALLGDPALHLSTPSETVVVTHINGRPVEESRNDSIEVLTEVTVEGEIRNEYGEIDRDFNGEIRATAYDRETLVHTLANDNEGTEIAFWQQKNILYKGVDTVVGGRFSYQFIVPRDVAYEYGRGKLSHYAHSANIDATGAYTNIFFGGLDTSAASKEVFRPTIKLYMNDSTFRSGGCTNESPYIYAIIEDSLGINSVGSGLGHDILATLDGNGNSVINLNDFYKPNSKDGKKGEIRYHLEKLTPGWHTIVLKAWNIYNYSNSAAVKFNVVASDNTEVVSFFAHPNPASDYTEIRIEHNAPKDVVQATVAIYDQRGQKVKTYNLHQQGDSFVIGPLRWDFTSESGAKVENGMYIAHLTVTTANGETISKHSKIIKIK